MRNTFIIQGKPKTNVQNVQYVENGTQLGSAVIRLRVNDELRKYVATISQVDKSVKPIPNNISAFLIVDGLIYVEFSNGSIGRTPLTAFDGFRLTRYLFSSPTNKSTVPKWLTPSNV